MKDKSQGKQTSRIAITYSNQAVRNIKQSPYKPYQHRSQKSIDRLEYLTFVFIRIHFEDTRDKSVPKPLKDVIHQYTLFYPKMAIFSRSRLKSIRDLIRVDMKQTANIKYTKSINDQMEIICISSYGDMTLDKNCPIMMPKSDDIKDAKLEIYATNIYLRSHICCNQMQINIICNSLSLQDGCIISGKNINININKDLGFGDNTMIESAENINVNIGGNLIGNGLTLKANMTFFNHKDRAAIRLNCNDDGYKIKKWAMGMSEMMKIMEQNMHM